MPCELCGKEAAPLLAEVEGAELHVCINCAKYGQVKKRNSAPLSPPPKIRAEEPEYRLILAYAQLLRSAREKKGLSQADFAKFIKERESVVAKWEAGSVKPSLETARKLERRLGIRLVEVEGTEAVKTGTQGKNEELTLGDLVKVRIRK